MKMKRTVLIVDDELDFTDALRTALLSESCQILTASDRTQAEAMVRTHRPNIIVLGPIVPRGDAYRLHRWVKDTPGLSNIPIIAINARREDELIRGWTREEGMQCDAEDLIAKPVNVAALLPRIERLLDKATERIKVLVADDHAIVRDGIRAVLTLQRDMEVVGEAVNGKEALEKTIELSPDVVLMDIVMPTMNGLDATRQLCKKCPLAKVLMLSQYDDEENVLASCQAGALGFIPKTAVSSQLLAGIRSVRQGKRFLPSAVG